MFGSFLFSRKNEAMDGNNLFLAESIFMEETADRIFGMMPHEALAVTDELCRQTDKNHPTKSGSNQDFISTIRAGRDALCKQPNYCKQKETE
jgi:hypothetical protein